MSRPPLALPPTKLQLDRRNPRLGASPRASQEVLRRLLIEQAEVIELAKKIIRGGGLNPGERVVVTKEGGQWVVLEGNRRSAACQIIVDPLLCPAEYRGRLGIIPASVQRVLKKIPIDVVPTRESALPMIANRHAGRGVLRWRPEMRNRFVAELYHAGKNVSEIGETLSLNVNMVRKALMAFHLMHRVRTISWKPHEASQLAEPQELKTNPFTRFFETKEGRSHFPFEITDKGKMTTSLTDVNRDEVIQAVARLLLFKEAGDTKPPCDTRTPPASVVARAAAQSPKVAALVKVTTPAPKEGGTGNPKPSAEGKQAIKKPKKADFFEGYVCVSSDDWCQRLSEEISRINWRSLRNAAGFLLRALVEASLQDAFKTTKHYGGLQQAWKTAGHKSGNPELGFMMDYAIANQKAIFNWINAGSILGTMNKEVRVKMNSGVHGSWRFSEQDLSDAAGHARRFLEAIHDRSGLVMPGTATGSTSAGGGAPPATSP